MPAHFDVLGTAALPVGALTRFIFDNPPARWLLRQNELVIFVAHASAIHRAASSGDD